MARRTAGSCHHTIPHNRTQATGHATAILPGVDVRSGPNGRIRRYRRDRRASPRSVGVAGIPADGLIRLVLTLVKLLHDVLERQAVRRMSGGQLTPTEIESVGTALLAQTLEIERLRRHFGVAERDLALQLDRHPSQGSR